MYAETPNSSNSLALVGGGAHKGSSFLDAGMPKAGSDTMMFAGEVWECKPTWEGR